MDKITDLHAHQLQEGMQYQPSPKNGRPILAYAAGGNWRILVWMPTAQKYMQRNTDGVLCEDRDPIHYWCYLN